MQIISQFVPLPLADPAQGTAVAMGYFDGIHIGHRAVIDGAVQWARAHGAAPAVFTFLRLCAHWYLGPDSGRRD